MRYGLLRMVNLVVPLGRGVGEISEQDKSNGLGDGL